VATPSARRSLSRTGTEDRVIAAHGSAGLPLPDGPGDDRGAVSKPKLALLYPPPWKMPGPGELAPGPGEGPPEGYQDGDLDADFFQIPYGLLQLGAEARRAGHPTKVLNLSAFPWSRVESVIAGLDADVFGMSCWTANRRGVAMATRAIKRLHPKAVVVIGGPHATPLARDALRHWPEVDLVVRGEGDLTMLDLLQRVEQGAPLSGIPGTAYRDGDEPKLGPDRKSVDQLDTLASVHDHFTTHIAMTSRGCPWACTFCGAETSWGRGFRSQSIGRVVDDLEKAIARAPVKMVQIKDDTFTTNKKRVLALCREILARGLRFVWSCDTRVDLLTDELLREMRLAGCQRLSLGVESGSQRVLDAIDKKITVAEIEESTRLAKRWGIKVRYYMMLGNRADTAETFRETLAFLERAQPHEYLFSCLSFYPGTPDFHVAEDTGRLDRNVYFTDDFQELKAPFDASDEDLAVMDAWWRDHKGLRTMHRETAAEYRDILERLGDHAPAHMDLAGALLAEGDPAGAAEHAKKALELGYPLPGLALNLLACAAQEQKQLGVMMDALTRAAKEDPQHWILIRNVNAARAWFKDGGPASGRPLVLEERHDFQLLERTAQPTLPGPLPPDWSVWDAPSAEGAPAPDFIKTPEQEGSTLGLGGHGLQGGQKPGFGRKLKVV
jgi:anaerobic magnesium-protoporphyrin IX monomethyl ester cyclase